MVENSQHYKSKEAAKELGCDEDEARFDDSVKKLAKSVEPKVCPECDHVFKGNGWGGIDAHWRSKHEDIMPYEKDTSTATVGTERGWALHNKKTPLNESSRRRLFSSSNIWFSLIILFFIKLYRQFETGSPQY